MAFPSVFPGDIDSYVPKADGIDDVMAVDVNELQSALVAIETALHAVCHGSSQFQILTTGATPFAPVWSGFKLGGTTGGVTVFAVASGKILTFTAANDLTLTFTGGNTTLNFGATNRAYTFPDTAGTVALLQVANSFTLINPLTTIAESWIGPSSTTGIYFKGGFVGIGTTNPLAPLDVWTGGATYTARFSRSTTQYMQYQCDAGGNTIDAVGPKVFLIRADGACLGFSFVVASNVAMTFATNNTTRMTIGAAGGVAFVEGFGCNGATPQTAYSLGAASTDLATVVALANKLRLMAIANGTGSA